MTMESLKEAVQKLSTQERILFVQYVLDTIAADTAADAPLSEEWLQELEERKKMYENGELKTRSWAAIKDRLIQNNR